MVSKRRRVARKKFKEANPHLFPKPDPPSDNPETNEKKEKPFKNLKRGVAKPGSGYGRERSSGSKHPLRIPGQRPGEACFVCGAGDHVAKACPEKAEWEKNKICLLCRRRGHSLKNCRYKTEESAQKLCYNCGNAGHSLNKCPEPLQNGGAKFASCFVCNEQGHLSKDCPKNPHGIYPKGGCCNVCGGVTHLAKNCPKKYSQEADENESEINEVVDQKTWEEKEQVFRSGDDLEDDFGADEEPSTGKKPKIANPESVIGQPEVKPKVKNFKPEKKNGPKVVNFLG